MKTITDLKNATETLLDTARLESELSGVPIPEDYAEFMQETASGRFSIVVMGEVKKGKSSFINALLGKRDLVPVASDIATSTVFRIHYGESVGYTVHFLEGSGKETLPIDAENLAAFGTEIGNPGNAKQVDYIEVSCPSPILQAGVEVVDTPGLGGLYRGHKKITWQYAPQANAVFFTADSAEAPIGRVEIDNLREVLKITKEVYFIQTKTSVVDSEDREARRENNLKILSNALGLAKNEIPYYLVDSIRKLEADETKDEKKQKRSGFPQLIDCLEQHLLPDRYLHLALRAAQYAGPTLAHVGELDPSPQGEPRRRQYGEAASLGGGDQELAGRAAGLEEPRIPGIEKQNRAKIPAYRRGDRGFLQHLPRQWGTACPIGG